MPTAGFTHCFRKVNLQLHVILRSANQQHQGDEEVGKILSFHVITLCGVYYPKSEYECPNDLSKSIQQYFRELYMRRVRGWNLIQENEGY